MFTRSFDLRTITSWNEGSERLYGWTREEAVGKPAAELLCSEYPIPLEEIEQELLRSGRWEGNIRQCRKDGSPVTVAGRWGLQTDPEGKPYAILEINSDLTTSLQTSERLSQAEERFRLFVSAVVDYAIFMLDPGGIVISWNEGAQRIKGYSADEIIGQHFSILYPAEDRANGKPDRALATAERNGRYLEEGWRVRKDGSRFWASVVITALRDGSGHLRGFGKVTRDITEKHDDEQRFRAHARQIAESEQAKTHFLDLAAHELAGPLTILRGYASMFEGGTIPPERIPEVARLIEGKLEQINLLVAQMLEMGRLEDGRLDLHLETFDLLQLTLEEMAKLRPIADKHDLAIAERSIGSLVKADRSRIGTIIANLLDNAIKYSPNGGLVSCHVGTEDSRAFVAISDKGLGIAPEHISLLFRRFSRLPTEANRRIPGTGLALFLCREIAHKHGGDIQVRSGLDGSTFTLTLPAASPA